MALPSNQRRLARRAIAVFALLIGVFPTALQSAIEQDRGGKLELPAELALVPQDGFGFIYVRPAELWKSDGVAKFRKLYPAAATALLKALGDDPADTESFAVIFPNASSAETLLEQTELDRYLISRWFHYGLRKEKRGPKGFDKLDFPPKEPAFKKDEPAKEVVQEKPGMWFMETTVKPMNRATVLKRVLGEGAVENKYKERSYFTPRPPPSFWGGALHFISDRTILFAFTPETLHKAMDTLDRPRLPSGPLDGALELAVSKRQVVMGLNLLDPLFRDVRAGVTEELNSRWNRDPLWIVAPLLPARSLAMALDVGKQGRVSVQGSVSFPDAEKADEAVGPLRDAVDMARIFTLGKTKHVLPILASNPQRPPDLFFQLQLAKQADTVVRGLTVSRRQATVQFALAGDFDLEKIQASAKSAEASFVPDKAAIARANRVHSVNNLKQIALAMHAYHDVYKHFPRAAVGTDGKPNLSWRVAILPYIEQTALYNQFDMNLPWDHPHNKKLIDMMPAIYQVPGGKEKGRTHYQVFVGKGTAFERTDDRGGISIAQITDGTSNTFMVAEAADPVIWTKPEDMTFDPDPEKPLPKLGGVFEGGFHVAFCDGSVHFVQSSTSPEMLRAGITRNGGEILFLKD